MARKKPDAVAYYRTSSAANVGQDKDSQRRQAEAVEGYAKGRHAVVASPLVTPRCPVPIRWTRAQASGICSRLPPEAHGVSVVLVENARVIAA